LIVVVVVLVVVGCAASELGSDPVLFLFPSLFFHIHLHLPSGAKTYGISLDIWSLGCIFVELWTGKPLFRGNDDLQQLKNMFCCLGAPNEQIWPSMMKYKNSKTVLFQPLVPDKHLSLKSILQTTSMTSSNGLAMIASLLTYDPQQRPTAESLLSHSYFEQAPRPLAEYMMPTFSTTHQVTKDPVRKPKNRK
tara:strand:+ start:95 stop:670 length:576 start_codon:yes stop_codon:yes gene_type:complete